MNAEVESSAIVLSWKRNYDWVL